MNLKNLLCSVSKIIEEDGQLLLKKQKRGKGADIESYSFIARQLQNLTPDIQIYSEENKEKLRQICWVIDPIDGSFNYYHNDFFWSISIALVKNERTQLGVVYLPSLKQLIGVSRKNHVITKEVSLSVRPDKILSRAMLWMDWDKEGKLTPVFLSKIAKEGAKLGKKGIRVQIRQCCSASLIAVATGRISAFIHPGPNPEDISAGGLIVEKAGGKVTDLDGNPWGPFSKSIVASNSLLHKEILRILKD